MVCAPLFGFFWQITMVKKDLVNRLAVYFPDFRKKDLEYLVDLLFERLTQALVEGERIEIRGFGRFLLRTQKERLFTNPKTQEVRRLPARQRVIFKPGKDIKDRLNQPAYAALDLGTQTFRLIVGKPGPEGLRVLLRARKNVRLGEGLAREGRISPEAFVRGMEALREFKALLEGFKVKNCLAAGTAVFREAENASEFIAAAENLLGVPIKILSPEEEAETTFWGVKNSLATLPSPFVIADVGGGSTEIIFPEGKELFKDSLPLGAVRLLEGFIQHDPPTPHELETLRTHIQDTLAKLPRFSEPPKALVATGGTASCLASLDLELESYQPERTHGHQIKLRRLQELAEDLKERPRKERATLKGMEPGREDIILPGLLIYLALLGHFQVPVLTVSESGILEGLLMRAIEERP